MLICLVKICFSHADFQIQFLAELKKKVLWSAESIVLPVLITVFFQVGERIIDLDSNEAVVKARGPFVETCWRASLQIMRKHNEAC